jgi:hypothetical protein
VRLRLDLQDPLRAGAEGENDQVLGIEDLKGGHASDTIAGDERDNSIFGGVGRPDRMSGRGGTTSWWASAR